MKIHNVLAGIAAVAFFASCLPDPLDVASLPQARTEMVVSTQIVSERSLMVLVTRTFGALDASGDSDPQALLDSIAVNDATVTIEGPRRKDTLTALGNGMYGSVGIRFRPGQVYRLFVNSRSLGEVSATTEVKSKVSFDNVHATLEYNAFGDTLAQITYSFKDPIEQNWYMINVQEVEREDLVENLLNPRAFTLLYTDEHFNGQAYGERFQVFPRDFHPGDTLAVSIANISEAYYRFMKLRMDNRLSLVEFVSEPVDYPSNVVGGRGYFNLHLPDVRFLVLD